MRSNQPSTPGNTFTFDPYSISAFRFRIRFPSASFTPWTDELAERQGGGGADAGSSLPSEPGSYFLTGNVTLPATWQLGGAAGTIHLCLNGHSITYSNDNYAVLIDSGAALDLYDEEENAGSITGSSTGGVLITGGSFTMNGGSISGNGDSGVRFTNGSFTLNGGVIEDNRDTDGSGSNVCMMEGQTISAGSDFPAEGTRIGVTLRKQDGNDWLSVGGVFTTGGSFGSDEEARAVFFADDDTYTVIATEDGEGKLAVVYDVTVVPTDM